MDKILNFLVNYYQIIISLVVAVFTLVFYCLRKRPSSSFLSEAKASIAKELPNLINDAEKIFTEKSGCLKKDLVISSCMNIVKKVFCRALTDDEYLYFYNYCSTQLELILSTPTKKEEI